MRHGKMGRHGDTVGHGHGNLLVLLVACRGLGAHHLSVLLKLESLRALVVDLYVEWVNTSAIEALRRYSATQGASLTRTTSCTRDDGERPSRESAGARGRHSRAQARSGVMDRRRVSGRLILIPGGGHRKTKTVERGLENFCGRRRPQYLSGLERGGRLGMQ